MHPKGRHPNNKRSQVARPPDLTALSVALRNEDPATGVDDPLVDVLGRLFREIAEIRALLAGRVKSHYAVEELAEITGRSAYTIRRWISEGRLDATRIEGTGPRGKLLIARDQVQRLVTSGIGDRIPPTLID
jgi:excisionase family DNA binding protein